MTSYDMLRHEMVNEWCTAAELSHQKISIRYRDSKNKQLLQSNCITCNTVQKCHYTKLPKVA